MDHENPSTDQLRPDLDEERCERGAGLVEYALLLALIALVCIAGVMRVGGETNEGPRGIDRSASSIIDASDG